jgi:hypothetical protein
MLRGYAIIFGAWRRRAIGNRAGSGAAKKEAPPCRFAAASFD